jgi:hypothetical protein
MAAPVGDPGSARPRGVEVGLLGPVTLTVDARDAPLTQVRRRRVDDRTPRHRVSPAQ